MLSSSENDSGKEDESSVTLVYRDIKPELSVKI